ncbi:SDR family oxidoreductase [Lipingzhangella sp. LS1_29]|uniref:SDR family oxidoreductase n=1 Tax=Lipingzhangella rawalii TaxID=2055835 RepID=A0ABU2H977_9ACTN|nr:SDR family oxidoreductase [Lipingzhangella rawalii]MDS1271868.1 SDR family oxidoreductase [Lipingzhangella rawalii]
MNTDLRERVALVAGGTRGASRAIAVELARAGAYVYVTGRSSGSRRSEVNRPETIEGTAAAIEAAGGRGTAIRVDHLEPQQVHDLAKRIDAEHGKLDILVNGLWGGDGHLSWDTPVWKHPLETSLRMIRLGVDAHLITAHHLLPLMIRKPGGLVVELTDGTEEYNTTYRSGTTMAFYVAKSAIHPLARAEAAETSTHGCTAVGLTPGWLRSEAMLDEFGVGEENWRDAIAQQPHFAISESPAYVGRTVAALAADPERGRFSGQTLNSGQLAQRYGITDVDGSQPDGWRYITEIADAGHPADTMGYR